jgi:hypothetical protein
MDLLLACVAASAWLFLIIVSAQSTGWGNHEAAWLMMPVALILATVAFHRLVKEHENSWALAASLAGLVVLAALLSIAVVLN